MTDNIYKLLNIDRNTFNMCEISMLNISFFIPNSFEIDKKATEKKIIHLS